MCALPVPCVCLISYPSLPQWPRSEAEQARFAAALKVMGDLYASAIGTTALQLKAIPPRPPAFDGALCLFGVGAGLDELAIRSTFTAFGQVDECSHAGNHTVVRFATRLAALDAKGHGAPTAVCASIEFQYNERKYDERGWCVFEEAVADELVVRLNANVRSALEALPPKKIVLGEAPPRDDPMRADTRVETVVERIVAATFTGAGDKAMVISLYKEYAERISRAVLAVMVMPPQVGAGAVAAAGPRAQLPSVSLEPPDESRCVSPRARVVHVVGERDGGLQAKQYLAHVQKKHAAPLEIERRASTKRERRRLFACKDIELYFGNLNLA